MRSSFLAVIAVCLFANVARAEELPPGYWPPERTPEILELTRTVRLSPSLTDLTPGERRAVQELIEAGKIMQRIYEDARHPQALEAFDALEQLATKMGRPPEVQSLLDLYRLFKGPIATTSDNRREAFMPVESETPGRNVYPSQLTRAQFDAYLVEHPDERSELLAQRTVVRENSVENVKRDLALLNRHPTISMLHPGLRRRLQSLQGKPDNAKYYAIPYSLRWANELARVYTRLNNAARHVQDSDEEFARFLRNRARDLLSDDYESGDAAWVTGNFKRLNALIGAYETYDDALYGAKAFMSLSILKRDEPASRAAREAVRDLQSIENALPSPQHRRALEDISVGVYDVIADFGQARGRNSATVLPNDPLTVKRYGRVMLLRENVLRNAEIFANSQAMWKALMASPFDADLTEEGEFTRVLWHEIGHYLGVDRDKRGRPLDVALEASADTLEELKADLVSLFVAPMLRKSGNISDHDVVMWYASGLNRTLQDAKPRRDQPYQTMQLMQFNWLHERGAFEIEPTTGAVMIHYQRFPEAIHSMLESVLKIQHEGDETDAAVFIERWTAWRADLHDLVAKTLRDSRQFQHVLIRYGAMGE
ncbi:MAG: NUDIX hydrolase [Candidatus Obscuribacterales bacterium]|nr:NUDIX hydrolase [Steroidobacteraceae bacterium]